MEENRENDFNLQPTPPKESVAERAPKKGNALIFTNILLTLLVIGLGIYIFIEKEKVKEENRTNDKKTDIVKETEQEEKYREYKGDYISAKLPPGWNICEHTGSSPIATVMKDDAYSGLTDLTISKDDIKIFEMRFVNGIGLLGCPEYVKFKDFSPAKIQEIEKENKEIGMTTEYIDYTNTPYTEFIFLGSKVRRVGNRLFDDPNSTDEYFDPGCLGEIILLKDISVTAIDNQTTPYKINVYQITISDNQTEDTLKELDKILESFRPV